MKPNGTKENNDLTYVSNNAINVEPGECSATVTVNNMIINDDSDNGLECDFKRIVEKYMRCEKRTLAEMLAMRDMDKKDGDDMLKKIIESPDTWKVHPEPINPNPYPYLDYSDFCFNAPNNRCVRGGGWFKSCIGCPYYSNVVYTRTDGTGANKCTYCNCSTTNDVYASSIKKDKHRLDD